ncbi:MAG: response regulator [Desulfobulbus sp.]|nr:response regulator [Desulfobulbus sp.]
MTEVCYDINNNIQSDNREIIYVIEDSPLDIALILETIGDAYDIRVYTSGESALSAIKNDRPSLVLLDVVLPDIDGFEVCRKIKTTEFTRDIPIVFLTTLNSTMDEEKSFLMGAADFIRKPIEPSILKHRVLNQVQLLEKYHDQQMRSCEIISQREGEVIQHTAIVLLKSMDPHTGEHIANTQQIFTLLAKGYRTICQEIHDVEQFETMALASALHDIGKTCIPVDILDKKGPLNLQEVHQVRQHTLIGGNIIKSLETVLGNSNFLRFAGEMALFHHEKWDGTGYPYGLSHDKIPLSARIMALVDVYEALTSRRPYRKSLTHKEAYHIITKGDGRIHNGHFDPQVLVAFSLMQHDLAALSMRETCHLNRLI